MRVHLYLINQRLNVNKISNNANVSFHEQKKKMRILCLFHCYCLLSCVVMKQIIYDLL